MNNKLEWSFVGRMAYSKSLELQRSLQNNIISGNSSLTGHILFLEHEPVITVGKFGSHQNLLTNEESLKKKGIELFETERGGDFTYHGPGQLVCYPILDLKRLGLGVKKYIYLLEEVIIQTLKDYDVDAGRKSKYPGVWFNDSKIAFVGIYVRRRVTMHGFSLNVDEELDNFSYIIPCGLQDLKLTSIENVLNKKIDLQVLIENLVKKFKDVFGIEIIKNI